MVESVKRRIQFFLFLFSRDLGKDLVIEDSVHLML